MNQKYSFDIHVYLFRIMVPLVLSLKFRQVTLNIIIVMFLTGDATAVATFHSAAWAEIFVP